MKKYCENCGAELPEGADICVNCGKALKNHSSNNAVDDADKKAKTGLTLGLFGLIAWLLPLAGYPVTICGIVFSSKGLKSTTNKTKAVVGLVLSILCLLVTLCNSILGVILNVA